MGNDTYKQQQDEKLVITGDLPDYSNKEYDEKLH